MHKVYAIKQILKESKNYFSTSYGTSQRIIRVCSRYLKKKSEHQSSLNFLEDTRFKQ